VHLHSIRQLLSIWLVTMSRRIAAPNAKNSSVLLDAAEKLMLEEGYAAVTSRRVAAEAGLKPQLVHYYFRTMDDLFLEVFRRRAKEGIERQTRALASATPLRALWEYSIDSRGTALTMEFIALANHRKVIQTEIARYAEQFRVQQVEAITTALERAGINLESSPLSPVVVSVLMTSLSRVLVMEASLGMSAGQAETAEFVENCLRQLEEAHPN
jgi:TetR/AcrR family transcriptional regulator